ncbi:MAG: hypothetical protein GY940_34580 [bacterium]|nr:hypothetical protein [bacterium]
MIVDAVEFRYLKHLLENLRRAKSTLEYSYGICKRIGVKDEYSEDEQDRFESMSSKFARLTDLILKQAVKTVDLLDLEDPPQSMRDAINRAERKGLVSSALTFIEIRKMRNKIAHEYVEEGDQLEMYKFVLQNAPVLFDTVARIERHCERYSSS